MCVPRLPPEVPRWLADTGVLRCVRPEVPGGSQEKGCGFVDSAGQRQETREPQVLERLTGRQDSRVLASVLRLTRCENLGKARVRAHVHPSGLSSSMSLLVVPVQLGVTQPCPTEPESAQCLSALWPWVPLVQRAQAPAATLYCTWLFAQSLVSVLPGVPQGVEREQLLCPSFLA